MRFILFLIFSYLLGSIPTGYLISKSKGTDIRRVGSGNIGGTNVARAFGWKWGLLVAMIDILKGVIPVSLAIYSFHFNEWQIAMVALAAILGHVFPVWLDFKGGKGVATLLGALLVLFGWKIFLIWLFCWILVLAILRIMSLTNLILVLSLPFFFWIFFHSFLYFIFGVVAAGILWWAHRENVERLRKGKEPKVKFNW